MLTGVEWWWKVWASFYGPKIAKLGFFNYGPILTSQDRQLQYKSDYLFFYLFGANQKEH